MWQREAALLVTQSKNHKTRYLFLVLGVREKYFIYLFILNLTTHFKKNDQKYYMLQENSQRNQNFPFLSLSKRKRCTYLKN